MFTDRNVDIEDAFESLYLGHGWLALCRALVTLAGIGYFSVVWLVATHSRRHLRTMLAIGREDSWKRVRLTRGLAASAANLAMKSKGSNRIGVVPLS